MELDDTAADRNRLSFEQGFLERQLSDLKSERSVLAGAVDRLSIELDARAAELGRTLQRQGELIRLSQDLSIQLDSAHASRHAAALTLSHRATELQEAASKNGALQHELAALRRLAAERAPRLHPAK